MLICDIFCCTVLKFVQMLESNVKYFPGKVKHYTKCGTFPCTVLLLFVCLKVTVDILRNPPPETVFWGVECILHVMYNIDNLIATVAIAKRYQQCAENFSWGANQSFCTQTKMGISNNHLTDDSNNLT